MEKVKPRTLSGFMELLPAPQVQMERIMQVLRETYALYGFYPLDTPLIESSEVLLAKGGGETEKQIYRFTKGDSDLSLRFDLTVPLAKYVAQHYGELTFPFRRFQIGKVYRGERAQRGRFREFYQADIDVIGDGKLDIINEAEVPSIIYKTFTSLGLERFKIRINNRKVLNGFFAILGLTEKAGDVMRTIDKLEKIGTEKVKTILVDDFGVAAETADELLAFIQTPGGTEGILAALEGYKGRNEVFDQGADELKTVAQYMQAFGVPAGVGIPLYLLLFIINSISGILIVYMCIAIGHSFNTHKILASVGVYVGMILVNNLISMIFSAVTGMISYGSSSVFIGTANNVPNAANFWLSWSFAMLLCLVTAAAGYLLSNYFMTKRLNLE